MSEFLNEFLRKNILHRVMKTEHDLCQLIGVSPGASEADKLAALMDQWAAGYNVYIKAHPDGRMEAVREPMEI